MVVAVGAILVAIFLLSYSLLEILIYGKVPVLELASIFTETLLALLAGKGHVEALHEGVVGGFAVALGTVEPFPAWR